MRSFWYKKLVILVFLFFASLEAENIESNVQDSTLDSNNTQEKVIESKTKEELKEEKKLQKLEQKQAKATKKAQKKQAKIDRIDKKNNRRYIASLGPISMPLPFFYTQFGAGFTLASSVSSVINQNVNATLNSSAPNFGVALGFNQQFDVWILHFGFKLQIGYEVALKGAGENTNTWQNTNIFSAAYVGFWRVAGYVGLGYEILWASNNLQTALSTQQGLNVGCGLSFVISKNGAIDLSFKAMVGEFNALSYNRLMLHYEFRF